MARFRPVGRVLEALSRSALLAFGEPDAPPAPGERVLVLAPHPDDETLGCGALIARRQAQGCEVWVAFATDGRRSHPQRDPALLGPQRRAEAEEACRRLGLAPERAVHLGFEDGGLEAEQAELIVRLAALLDRLDPAEVYVSSALDRQRDHHALGIAAHLLAQRGTLRGRLFEYPVWHWTTPWYRTWWARALCERVGLPWRVGRLTRHTLPRVVPAGEHLARKQHALAAHRTQMERLEPGWPVLADVAGGRFLELLLGEHELFFEVAPPAGVAVPRPEPLRVLHMVPNLAVGGGQVMLLRNVTGFDPRRVRSHVCSVWRDGPSSMTERFVAAGVPVLNLELRRSALPLAVLRLARYVRRHRIDLIHTNNTPWDRRVGALAARLTGTPVVNTFHSMTFSRRPPIDAIDERICAGRFHGAIAVSEAVRQAWSPYMRRVRLPEDEVRVIPAGVDLERFSRGLAPEREAALRRELDLEGAGPLLIDVARFAPGKGQAELAAVLRAALRRWPRAALLLVGDGPERPAIEAALAAQGVAHAARLVGQRDDVADLLALADVFVFPSAGEGLGIAVLEAMAAAKPVVAYDLPALRETLVPGESGLLVPVGDVPALGEAVLALLDDPARRERIGAAGRAAVEARFGRDRALRAIETLYEEVAGRPAPRRARPRSRPTPRDPLTLAGAPRRPRR